MFVFMLRYRETAQNVSAIKCNFDGTLKDILVYYKPRQMKKIFYQILTIKISELENKKLFKCFWVNSKLKEEVSHATDVLIDES